MAALNKQASLTRKLFQLHLSTALVLMFVAAGLVWLNVRKVKNEKPDPTGFGLLYVPPWKLHARGWPLEYQYFWGEYDRVYYSSLVSDTGAPIPGRQLDESSGVGWDRWHLAYNILVALAILAGVDVAVEWVVRKMGHKESI